MGSSAQLWLDLQSRYDIDVVERERARSWRSTSGRWMRREGRRAHTANVGSNDVSVIDLAEQREIGRVTVGLHPYAVAWRRAGLRHRPI